MDYTCQLRLSVPAFLSYHAMRRQHIDDTASPHSISTATLLKHKSNFITSRQCGQFNLFPVYVSMIHLCRSGYGFVLPPSPRSSRTALTKAGLASPPHKRTQRHACFTCDYLVCTATSHFPQATTLARHGDRAEAVRANVSAFCKPFFSIVTLLTRHSSLFNDPVLSDVKIKQICNGKTREYHAHKAILCAQSSYFLNAFTGNFKVSEDCLM
jgi:hypothetical protein